MIYFELLTVFFWALTYILIVISAHMSKTTKQVAMPYVAGVLNLAWEICAMIESNGGWVFILWFAIDILIVFYSFLFLNAHKKRIFYILSIILSCIVIHLLFKFEDGYVYTVYLIDFIMAICYYVLHRQLSDHLKLPIAVTRLIGDFFAGFVFGIDNYNIALISFLVLITNMGYLILCIKDRAGQKALQLDRDMV